MDDMLIVTPKDWLVPAEWLYRIFGALDVRVIVTEQGTIFEAIRAEA